MRKLCVFRYRDFLDKRDTFSAAGDLVQKQIFDSIEDHEKFFIAISPAPVWPKGPFYIKGSKRQHGKFISYLNLPILREMIFAFFILLQLSKCNAVIQYNSYFFTNLVIVLFKKIFNYKAIIILQDFRVGQLFSKKDLLADKVASKLLKYFDGYLPITSKFIQYLKLDPTKSIVFPGAITLHGINSLQDTQNIQLEDFAVYAGALEKHNGVKKLVDQWIAQEITMPLHIFGRGSLEGYIRSLQSDNIVLHGFKSSEEVYTWQSKAKFNFCFRFSDGLDEEFFFPSKFFNLVCYRGGLIVNEFKNLPDDLKPFLFVVEDDMSNLEMVMHQPHNDLNAKFSAISQYQWKFPISKILKRVE